MKKVGKRILKIFMWVGISFAGLITALLIFVTVVGILLGDDEDDVSHEKVETENVTSKDVNNDVQDQDKEKEELDNKDKKKQDKEKLEKAKTALKEADWSDEISKNSKARGDIIMDLGEQLENYAPTDTVWVKKISFDIVKLEELAKDGLKIEAPTKRTKKANKEYQKALKNDLWIANNLPKALDDFDEDMLNKVGDKMQSGTNHIKKALKVVDDIQDDVDKELKEASNSN